jgi:hypothetical protein
MMELIELDLENQPATEHHRVDARVRVLKARWESLADLDRAALLARFDRVNPAMPPLMHPELWELIRRYACLDLMDRPDAEVPVIAVATPPEPDPVPESDPVPIDDPPAAVLTAEQRAFLDGLTPRERAGFEGCTPARINQILLERRLGVLSGHA